MGLALDNNVIIFAFFFLFEGFFNPTVFSVIIYVMFLGMAVFNMAPVQTPKFSGKWFYVLMVYTVILTIIYGLILWGRT